MRRSPTVSFWDFVAIPLCSPNSAKPAFLPCREKRVAFLLLSSQRLAPIVLFFFPHQRQLVVARICSAEINTGVSSQNTTTVTRDLATEACESKDDQWRTFHGVILIHVGQILNSNARFTPATMSKQRSTLSKQHSTLLRQTATMSNDSIVKFRPFDKVKC